jgi:rubrerythrin
MSEDITTFACVYCGYEYEGVRKLDACPRCGYSVADSETFQRI